MLLPIFTQVAFEESVHLWSDPRRRMHTIRNEINWYLIGIYTWP